MKNHNRAIALLLSAALCFIMLFSAGFIAAKSSHICTNDNCPICAQLEMSRETLRNISVAVILTAVAAVSCAAVIFIPVFLEFFTVKTLVSLKIKLSN